MGSYDNTLAVLQEQELNRKVISFGIKITANDLESNI
jgi:hypothetical protein